MFHQQQNNTMWNTSNFGPSVFDNDPPSSLSDNNMFNDDIFHDFDGIFFDGIFDDALFENANGPLQTASSVLAIESTSLPPPSKLTRVISSDPPAIPPPSHMIRTNFSDPTSLLPATVVKRPTARDITNKIKTILPTALLIYVQRTPLNQVSSEYYSLLWNKCGGGYFNTTYKNKEKRKLLEHIRKAVTSMFEDNFPDDFDKSEAKQKFLQEVVPKWVQGMLDQDDPTPAGEEAPMWFNRIYRKYKGKIKTGNTSIPPCPNCGDREPGHRHHDWQTGADICKCGCVLQQVRAFAFRFLPLLFCRCCCWICFGKCVFFLTHPVCVWQRIINEELSRAVGEDKNGKMKVSTLSIYTCTHIHTFTHHAHADILIPICASECRYNTACRKTRCIR